MVNDSEAVRRPWDFSQNKRNRISQEDRRTNHLQQCLCVYFGTQSFSNSRSLRIPTFYSFVSEVGDRRLSVGFPFWSVLIPTSFIEPLSCLGHSVPSPTPRTGGTEKEVSVCHPFREPRDRRPLEGGTNTIPPYPNPPEWLPDPTRKSLSSSRTTT